MTKRRLRANQVVSLSYRCRDIGYGIEEDIIDAFWTGEVDTWGKYTIKPIDGRATLYLFPDEIVTIERMAS